MGVPPSRRTVSPWGGRHRLELARQQPLNAFRAHPPQRLVRPRAQHTVNRRHQPGLGVDQPNWASRSYFSCSTGASAGKTASVNDPCPPRADPTPPNRSKPDCAFWRGAHNGDPEAEPFLSSPLNPVADGTRKPLLSGTNSCSCNTAGSPGTAQHNDGASSGTLTGRTTAEHLATNKREITDA
jgi:hypothetical protein